MFIPWILCSNVAVETIPYNDVNKNFERGQWVSHSYLREHSKDGSLQGIRHHV